MKKKIKRVDYLIGILCLLNVITIPIFTKGSIKEIRNAHKILSNTAVAEGFIVDTVPHKVKSGYNYYAYIWFLDENNQEYLFETPSESTGDPSPIGEPIIVKYYKDDPTIAATGNIENWRRGNITLVTLGSFFILLPTFFILEFFRGRGF